MQPGFSSMTLVVVEADKLAKRISLSTLAELFGEGRYDGT